MSIERLRELFRKSKIKEQEELIKVLKRPEKQPRRPAAKFASNSIRNV